MARHTWRFFDYTAECQDCDWTLFRVNALGVAAQHHDRTGHTVQVSIEGSVTYASGAENERLTEQKRGQK